MRVVPDTNILISALISTTGAPARLLDAWRARRFELVSSLEQLEEFRAVSRRPQLRRWLERAEAGRFVRQLRVDALILETLPHLERSADPADNFLLAMAEAGHAQYLVSGDRRGVLALSTHGRAAIVTAAQMVDVLRLKMRGGRNISSERGRIRS